MSCQLHLYKWYLKAQPLKDRNLKHILPNERTQSEKVVYLIFPTVRNFWKKNRSEVEEREEYMGKSTEEF